MIALFFFRLLIAAWPALGIAACADAPRSDGDAAVAESGAIAPPTDAGTDGASAADNVPETDAGNVAADSGDDAGAADSGVPVAPLVPWDLSAEAATDGGHFYLYYWTNPEPLPLNEPFDLYVSVRDGANHATMISNAEIVIGAQMPEHGHSMNVQPVIHRQPDGSFWVDGMLFHMPGHWTLTVTVGRETLQEKAIFHVYLK